MLIENVTIYGDFNSPNNDGIDIEGSNNTVIRRCHIDTGDDAICPKTSTAPLFNLTVSDCWIRTKSCAVKLGSGSNFDFHGLRFERLKIVDSHRGLGFQIRDSGTPFAFENLWQNVEENMQSLCLLVLHLKEHQPENQRTREPENQGNWRRAFSLEPPDLFCLRVELCSSQGSFNVYVGVR